VDELEIIHVQSIAPRYRAIRWDGDWRKLMTAMPKLRFPYSHPIFPDEGYLLLDEKEDVVCGWSSSLEGFAIDDGVMLREPKART